MVTTGLSKRKQITWDSIAQTGSSHSGSDRLILLLWIPWKGARAWEQWPYEQPLSLKLWTDTLRVFTGLRDTAANPQWSSALAKKMLHQRDLQSKRASGSQSCRKTLSISSFHKNRGESARREIGLTPLVKIKWAHIYRHTHKPLASSAQTFTYLRLTFGMGILQFAASRVSQTVKCVCACVFVCEWVKNPFHLASPTNPGSTTTSIATHSLASSSFSGCLESTITLGVIVLPNVMMEQTYHGVTILLYF